MKEQYSVSRVQLGKFNASLGLDRGAPKWKEALWYLIKVFFFRSALPYPSSFKVILLRIFGAKVGKGTVIKPIVNIHFPWKLTLGNHVWLGEEAIILNFEPITIGNNVCISQRAFLCGGNHDFSKPSMPYRNGPITLKDGCWVGANSFIGPGVTIGMDTVVTVGSIVTKDLEDNMVCHVKPVEFNKQRWSKSF